MYLPYVDSAKNAPVGSIIQWEYPYKIRKEEFIRAAVLDCIFRAHRQRT
jgi:hypothetical protein